MTRAPNEKSGTVGLRLPSTALSLIIVVAMIALSGCTAVQPILGAEQRPVNAPGFWLGLWHGIIAPVAFIVSLFSDSVRVYAYPNTGRLYDFGFMLGIGGFSGGIFAGSRGKRERGRGKREYE